MENHRDFLPCIYIAFLFFTQDTHLSLHVSSFLVKESDTTVLQLHSEASGCGNPQLFPFTHQKTVVQALT